MKKKLLWCLFLTTTCIYAQEQTKLDKDDNFYLTFNKDEVYFIKNSSKKDNTIRLFDNNVLNIKRKSLDVYLNWLNPLQYKLIVQDSTVNDVRIDEIKKFFTENISVISNKSLKPTGTDPSIANCATIDKDHEISKLYPEIFKNYKDTGTNMLKTEYCFYWRIFQDIKNLNISDTDLKEKTLSLYNAITPSDADEAVTKGQKAIKDFEEKEDEMAAILFYLKKEADALTKTDDLPLKNEMIRLYTGQKEIFINMRRLKDLLKLYIVQVKSSLQKESLEFKGYYRIKAITLSDGKSSKVTLTLSQRELKDDSTLIDKTETKKITILIQRYDFITPKVGTGLFYANTKLSGFGTTTNADGQLIVSQDDIEKNTAVTGVFLNLIFDISSQFLTPYIQLGVDPTKERPYFLLGGGFAIMTHFSITAGPIWTWEPTLNKLEVGGNVTSSTALEDDISYKFNSSPKGFYVGLNYSF